ncbi:MAG: 16S rRNA (uracil(1498)-N(3))-methyltransferase [Deltaproteobacteria bacterium]|nr:16S rRNA (uracil(1498)-N(3))-methyltransferase [Deltaproteobacteria bacterium]
MIRVPLEGLTEGEIELDGAARRYVVRVHRLRSGEHFVAFDPRARKEADAELLSVGRDAARARISPLRPASLVAVRPLTLIQAAVKGAKLDGIVRGATELGVTRIVVATAERSVKRPVGDRLAVRLSRIAVEAARQCGRGDAPEVVGPEPLGEALATYAGESGAGRALCLAPGSDERLAEVLAGLQAQEGLILAVGPEGGLTEGELQAARRNGFRTVSLGRFVLRTETATTAALGVVAALG